MGAPHTQAALREGMLAGSLRTAATALHLALRGPAGTPRDADRVTFDEHGVLRLMRDGGRESVAWDELDEVGIVTLDGDHWADGLCFMLVSFDRSRGCAVPDGAHGTAELVDRLRQLPGFDEEALGRALESPGQASFVCWRRAWGWPARRAPRLRLVAPARPRA